MTLTNYTEAELRAELKRREEEEAKRRAQVRAERAGRLEALVPSSVELLKFLLPDHSRTTCDDSNPNQGRCTRCTVLSAIEEGDYFLLADTLRLDNMR